MIGLFANEKHAITNEIDVKKIEHKYNSASSYVTASMGLICKNANEFDNNFYKEADELLYEAKKSGRNQLKVNN